MKPLPPKDTSESLLEGALIVFFLISLGLFGYSFVSKKAIYVQRPYELDE